MSMSVFSRLIYFSILLLKCRSGSLPRIFVFHFRNTNFVTSSEKCFEFVLYIFSNIALFQKKTNRGRRGSLRAWNFQEYRRNRMQNFQWLVKKDVEFPGVIRKKLEFPVALVFGSGIFKGYQLTQLYITEIPGMKRYFLWNC